MNYWLVNGIQNGTDYTKEFIEQGHWIFYGNNKRNYEYFREIKVGEQIAIKSFYMKSKDLPFDNKELPVSTNAIHARGVVTGIVSEENKLLVDWQNFYPVREWYFYTYARYIWKIDRNSGPYAKRLYGFIFEDKVQDYEYFINQPYWADRYQNKLLWVDFYEELAKKVATYSEDRKSLISFLLQVNKEVSPDIAVNLDIEYSDGLGVLDDICPFSLIGLISRWHKIENLVTYAEKFANFFNLKSAVPYNFSGVAWSGTYKNWFFSHKSELRRTEDIDLLWDLFLKALSYAELQNEISRHEFIEAFDKAQTIHGVKWNITNGLSWIAPNTFLSLSVEVKEFLESSLNLQIDYTNSPTGERYLELLDEVSEVLLESASDIKSFSQLAARAHELYKKADVESSHNKNNLEVLPVMNKPTNKILFGPPGTGKTYHLTKLQQKYIVTESQVTEEQWLQEEVKPLTWFDVVFMTVNDLGGRVKVAEILAHKLFQAKLATASIKNPRSVIWGSLQEHTVMTSEAVGYKSRVTPFVFDKTEDSVWYLTGDWQEEMADQIELLNKLNQGKPAQVEQQHFKMLTFHQSYGYEDFIESLRPITNEEGQISYEVEDGVFKEICLDAKNNPQVKYAIFIDEINRGNISKIFGELITLIEPDKRTVYFESGKLVSGLEVVLPLSKEKFGVPKNLDIYGTMNTADRSISLLDTALRRRFEFAEMMPQVGVVKGSDDEGNIPSESGEINLRAMLEKINQRIAFLLNRDLTLGHSYLLEVKTFEDLQKVFLTKFIPLLQEYFYNDWKQIQLIFNDLDTYGNAQPEQIIQGKLIRADDIFNGLIDGLDEKYEYQVNANFTPEAVIKIYRNNG